MNIRYCTFVFLSKSPS